MKEVQPEPQTFCAHEHTRCVVCSPNNPFGLHLKFTLAEDGSVETEFPCTQFFEGYANYLHGGVISTLLDGAMTNCLYAHHIVAVTAELTVRYHKPVEIGEPVRVRAWREKQTGPLHIVRAELIQQGEVRSAGRAKFYAQPQLAGEQQD